ncbi:MAG: T9SS type A sorting domain-containing protein [Ignavibacteria bacterium]|nr:T9SS type A sorting domain-containing protein [Ignavibacteria bacterium]
MKLLFSIFFQMSMHNTTFYQLFCKYTCIILISLPIHALQAQLLPQKHSDDSPAARFEWELLKTVDPISQTLPAMHRIHEIEFARTLPVAHPHSSFSKKTEITSTEISLQFAPIGPYNIGGRTRAFAQDVDHPNIMLAGGVTGGVWRSIDAGASWTKTLPASVFQHVSCITQDKRPGKTNIWYMGTGEVLSTTDRRTSTNLRTILTGSGIYKSIDGGVSWSPLPATLVNSLTPNTLITSFQGVWDIAVNPANSTTDEVFAACYGGIMRSRDGGESWELVLGDSTNNCFNSSVVITPTGIIYGALSANEAGEHPDQYGVFRSSDDGDTWTDITPAAFPASVRRYRVAIAPSNPSIVYILTQKPKSYNNVFTDLYNQDHTFWKYTYSKGDGAGTGGIWQNRSILFSMKLQNESTGNRLFSSLSGYCLALAVKPDDENAVVIAGSNAYYSTNGFADGEQVKHIGGYPYIVNPPTSMHPDVHDIVFDIEDPNKLYSANDGGVEMLSNVTTATLTSWRSLNNGYTCTQFYGITLDHQAPGDKRVIGGFQDNSSFMTTTSSALTPWTQLTSGDGCVPNYRHKNSVAITSAQSGYVAANLLEEPSKTQFTLTPDDIANSTQKLFVTNPYLDPWHENVLFIPANNRLFTVPDLDRFADPTQYPQMKWVDMPRVADAIPQSNFITALTASRSVEDVLWLGTHLGKLYTAIVSASTGGAVEEITSPKFPKNAFISSISVDSKDPDLILTAFSNYNVISLFATTDGGSTWNAVAGNLEMNADGSGWGPSIRCVKILRKSGAIVYAVGTSTGLYTTLKLDGENTIWTQQGITTIGNLTVEAMDYRESDGQLIIGTHGGGAFASTLTVSAEESPVEYSFSLEQNFPNPVSTSTSIYFSLDKQSTTQLTIMNVNGQVISTLVESILPAGNHTITIPETLIAKLASGSYYYQLTSDGKSMTRLMTVVK